MCNFILFAFLLCLVCPMLSLYLDCPFFIAPSVFSNVYFGRELSPAKAKDKMKELGLLCLTPLSTISVISWQSVLLVEETGVPGENNRPTAKNERKIMLSMLR